MKYLIITSLTQHDKNAVVFDTRHHAVASVEGIINQLGFDVDPGESAEGVWHLSDNGVRVKFQLTEVDNNSFSFLLRKKQHNRHQETRRFRSRGTAVSYAEKFAESKGARISASSRDAGLWDLSLLEGDIEMVLTAAIETRRHSSEDSRILGVSVDADEDVIKAAYRAKLKKAHPDVGGSDDEVKRLNLAYERLMKDGSGSVHREEYSAIDGAYFARYIATLLNKRTESTSSTTQQAQSPAPAARHHQDNTMNEGILTSWPNWLRWLLAWPAGIIGSLLIGWLIRLVWGLFSSESDQPLLDLIQAGVIGFFWVYIPALFAPKAKRIVAIVSLCMIIGLLFLLGGMILLSLSLGGGLDSPGLFFLTITAYLVGSIIATVSVHNATE